MSVVINRTSRRPKQSRENREFQEQSREDREYQEAVERAVAKDYIVERILGRFPEETAAEIAIRAAWVLAKRWEVEQLLIFERNERMMERNKPISDPYKAPPITISHLSTLQQLVSTIPAAAPAEAAAVQEITELLDKFRPGFAWWVALQAAYSAAWNTKYRWQITGIHTQC